MNERDMLMVSIAKTIAEYRADDRHLGVKPGDPEHVRKWICQFSPDVRVPILRELDYVLARTYYTRDAVVNFLDDLVVNEKLAGADPRAFWKSTNLLEIQRAGNSQRDLLSMLYEILIQRWGLTASDCGGLSGDFIYLDDGLFSGNRIGNDLVSWIREHAPVEARVHVVTIAMHTRGQHYARKKVAEAAAAAKKRVVVKWWRSLTVEDRPECLESSDVLRPTRFPDDALVKEYAAYLSGLGFPAVLRRTDSRGRNEFFTSGVGRDLLEQEFLKAGVRIRDLCTFLHEYQRPLGNSILKTFGFGSMIVTYRNCPNSAPLALWAGHPWYPLFPRKTN